MTKQIWEFKYRKMTENGRQGLIGKAIISGPTAVLSQLLSLRQSQLYKLFNSSCKITLELNTKSAKKILFNKWFFSPCSSEK